MQCEHAPSCQLHMATRRRTQTSPTHPATDTHAPHTDPAPHNVRVCVRETSTGESDAKTIACGLHTSASSPVPAHDTEALHSVPKRYACTPEDPLPRRCVRYASLCHSRCLFVPCRSVPIARLGRRTKLPLGAAPPRKDRSAEPTRRRLSAWRACVVSLRVGRLQAAERKAAIAAR